MNPIDSIEAGDLKKSLPRITAGDTVRVHVSITEGDKQRIQVCEGVVIWSRMIPTYSGGASGMKVTAPM